MPCLAKGASLALAPYAETLESEQIGPGTQQASMADMVGFCFESELADMI